MEEIRSLAGPVVQRHFEKVEADRQALQARIDAEKAAKKAEDDARKAAEAEKAARDGSQEGVANKPDEEMTDADVPKAQVEEADSS